MVPGNVLMEDLLTDIGADMLLPMKGDRGEGREQSFLDCIEDMEVTGVNEVDEVVILE